MENTYTLYVHIVPKEITGFSHDKYYVGITKNKPEERWNNGGHGYNRKGSLLWPIIQQYGWDKIIHRIILTNLSKEHAFEMERLYIKIFRSNEFEYGYNGNDGGFGGNVKPLVPIVQYDLQGNYLKTWTSCAEAARSVGAPRSEIAHVAKSNRTSKGFQWKYITSPPPGPYKKHTSGKSGPRINKQGANAYQSLKVILLNTGQEYSCIKEAAKETGASKYNISKCCKLKKGSSGRDENRKRLVWRFYEDYIIMTQQEIYDAIEKAQHPYSN